MILEEKIIEHCAPTLASLKTANMFNYPCAAPGALEEEIIANRKVLRAKGLDVMILRRTQRNALVYVFRKERLQCDLRRDGVMDLLRSFGYETDREEACLSRLQERLRQGGCFPHEIGLFVGYPLEDVLGFIRKGPDQCRACGVWKVYCNEQETLKLFEKFKRCTQIYSRIFAAGRSLGQMTVAA